MYPYQILTIDDIDGEIWKPVEGFEGLYLISNYGRLKGVLYNIIKKQQINKKGYLRIGLSKAAKFYPKSVHRLVAIAFIPNPENKPEVNHKFGDKFDNRQSELEWATTKENIQDAFDKGVKSAKGEANNYSKYTSETILKVRNEYVRGKYGERKRLSEKYSIPIYTVKEIVSGRGWKHLNAKNENNIQSSNC